ncbi:MAG: hypothetical protein V1723_02725 [Candidatus Uhrbacteria bacterium]
MISRIIRIAVAIIGCVGLGAGAAAYFLAEAFVRHPLHGAPTLEFAVTHSIAPWCARGEEAIPTSTDAFFAPYAAAPIRDLATFVRQRMRCWGADDHERIVAVLRRAAREGDPRSRRALDVIARDACRDVFVVSGISTEEPVTACVDLALVNVVLDPDAATVERLRLLRIAQLAALIRADVASLAVSVSFCSEVVVLAPASRNLLLAHLPDFDAIVGSVCDIDTTAPAPVAQ